MTPNSLLVQFAAMLATYIKDKVPENVDRSNIPAE